MTHTNIVMRCTCSTSPQDSTLIFVLFHPPKRYHSTSSIYFFVTENREIYTDPTGLAPTHRARTSERHKHWPTARDQMPGDPAIALNWAIRYVSHDSERAKDSWSAAKILCNILLPQHSYWFKMYCDSTYLKSEDWTSLGISSLLGLKYVVESFLNEGADVNAQGGDYGNALQAALYRLKQVSKTNTYLHLSI